MQQLISIFFTVLIWGPDRPAIFRWPATREYPVPDDAGRLLAGQIRLKV
jgi:hypothetical protein